MDPTETFARLMGRDDDEIELDRAALLFAAVEYPELDVEVGIRELDHLADLLQPRLTGLHGLERSSTSSPTSCTASLDSLATRMRTTIHATAT